MEVGSWKLDWKLEADSGLQLETDAAVYWCAGLPVDSTRGGTKDQIVESDEIEKQKLISMKPGVAGRKNAFQNLFHSSEV